MGFVDSPLPWLGLNSEKAVARYPWHVLKYLYKASQLGKTSEGEKAQ